MKIQKLKLRGAIGIKKGLGVDEIEIDFSQFAKGLVALTGRNGSGKTTIMENLHPYRQMVSRSGSLQSHFLLKDSYRILEFEHEGSLYESRILIDALTGGSEAYLYAYQVGENKFLPLNDGKLTTYDIEIEKLLGSPELFFNSVFSGQKSKGIAELKPADRRKLFYELLNLNIYEGYLEVAKSDLKKAEIKLSEIEGSIRSLTTNAPDAVELEQQRIKSLNEQAEITAGISGLETDIEQCQNNIRELEIIIATSKERLKTNEDLEKKIKLISDKIDSVTKDHKSKLIRLNSDVEDNRKLIERNQKLLENKDLVLDKIQLIEDLKNDKNEKQIKLNSVNKDLQEVKDKFYERQTEISANEKILNQKRIELSTSNNQLQILKSKLNETNKSVVLIDEVPCTAEVGSECQFLKNAYENKKLIPSFKNQYDELTVSIAGMKEVIEKLEKDNTKNKQMSEEELEVNSAEYNSAIQKINNAIQNIDSQLTELQKTDWAKINKEADQAENNINLLEEKIKNTNSILQDASESHEANIVTLKQEAQEAQEKLDLELPKKIVDLEIKLDNAKLRLNDLNSALKNNNASLESLEISIKEIDVTLEQLKNTQKRIDELNEEKKNFQHEISDWTFLCKAFDKTGIPVLKLENSGIEITTIANELLSLFENKFRIVFETTSLTKDKKKTKDTFDINIVEEDGVCEIGNKSGGQQVWLETAIQLAISLVVRNQGRNIETAFLDEKDGALDLENAYSYIEMLRKAHDMSGVHNTFVITHRTELLDFIPQQVKLTDGYLQILN